MNVATMRGLVACANALIRANEAFSRSGFDETLRKAYVDGWMDQMERDVIECWVRARTKESKLRLAQLRDTIEDLLDD